LRELLRRRGDWAEEETIYMVEPWSLNADALLSGEGDGTIGPIMRSGIAYAYFLEGFIVRELLEDIAAPDDVDDATCERLIYYANNDAWPVEYDPK
jgi:hypothetical protein